MSGLFFVLFLIVLHTLAVGETFISWNSMDVDCLLLFLALAALMFVLPQIKRDPKRMPGVFPGSLWLMLFFFWALLGFFFSVRPESSFPFINKYAIGIVLLLFLHHSLSHMEQVRRVFRILSLVAVLGGVASWFLQAAYPQLPGITRSFLFLNSNFRGDYLLFPLAMLAALYLTQPVKWKKGLTWSLIVLCWAQFGFIGSRGSYAAAFVVLAVLMAGLIHRKEMREAGALFLGCAMGWVMFKLVFVILQSLGSTGDLERSLVRSPTASSLYHRILFWDAAVRIFLEHPLVGSGSWTFPLLFPHQDLPPFLQNSTPPQLAPAPHVHNLYLQILSETGIVGLGLFLASLFYFFRRLFPALKSKEPAVFQYGLCLTAGMAGYLAHNLIETMWPAPYFIFTVVIWFGMAGALAPLKPWTPIAVRISKTWKYLPIPVLLVAVMILWTTSSYIAKTEAIKSGRKTFPEQLELAREAADLCPACDFPDLHRAFIFTSQYERTREPKIRDLALQAVNDARKKSRYIPEADFIEGLLLELDGNYSKAMGRYLEYYRTGLQPKRALESLSRIRSKKRAAGMPPRSP